MKEYEFSGNIQIDFVGECCNKLKEAELKKRVKKVVEEYLEEDVHIAEYDVLSVDSDIDYEVLD